MVLGIFQLQVQQNFKKCARSYHITSSARRFFHVSPTFHAPSRRSQRNVDSSATTNSSNGTKGSSKSPDPFRQDNDLQDVGNSQHVDLVPRPPKSGSLQHSRRPDVPFRVLPKAQVSPDLTLSPIERLRIESMTRRPPKAVEKPVFRDRLLIYHGGLGYTNYIAMLRVTTMFAASIGLLIMAPAYYSYDAAPWWTVPLIVFATTGPFFLVHFLARPFVCWIYLSLPLQARCSPSAALEYSRNLPRDAVLQIAFMRATALVGRVEVRMADLAPRQKRWPPTTFEWVGRRVNKGSWFRSNTTHFFVNKRSGTGKAARDTVPGIWESVYKQIMGSEASARGSSFK